jgi:hypothetical protein
MGVIFKDFMQKIIWHYFCRNTKPNTNKYLKYLMISIDSLIKVGGVDPKDIFVSLDIPENLISIYLEKILSYKINIRKAPIYKNHSKTINLCNTIKENKDIDKIVQIDCDTLITDVDIVSKIAKLESAVHHTTIGWPINKVFLDRDGLRHPTWGAEHITGTGQDHSRNLLFSVANEDGGKNCKAHRAERYAAFKDFMNIVFDFNLDVAIESLKPETRMMVGYLVVFSPKLIPENYFRFISTLDLFFSCDETVWTLGRLYSGLVYGDVNKEDKIVHEAVSVEDFKKLKGIIHFPVKDEKIEKDIDKMAQEILLI